MNCSSCGYQNRPGVRFCEQCGNPLSQPQATETTGRFCTNCGQPNPLNSNFCSSCGANFSAILPKQHSQPSFWSSVRKVTGWVIGGVLITLLVLTVWGTVDTLSPALSDHTSEAEVLAVEFVQQHYPELANAERTTYVANVDGIDYYVVDFVLNDSSKSPSGVRILVDRLLRAVFTYEYIEG